MINIRRYQPLDAGFEDLFRHLFAPAEMTSATEAVGKIKMDISETETAYEVRAELPGVKKDDIHVSIDGKQVSISAEVKNDKAVKEGERVLRAERHYGKTVRSFTLAQDVDEAAANAKFTDGVLELALPKKAAASAKRLEIH